MRALPYLVDDCGMPLVRCQHAPCRRTREATGPEDDGPWSCPAHAYRDDDGPPPGWGDPPTDAECDEAADAYERGSRRER